MPDLNPIRYGPPRWRLEISRAGVSHEDGLEPGDLVDVSGVGGEPPGTGRILSDYSMDLYVGFDQPAMEDLRRIRDGYWNAVSKSDDPMFRAQAVRTWQSLARVGLDPERALEP